jgi:site-specific DNA-cytosine methylase
VGPRITLPDGVRLARKSSRPRAKASAGGYATWVDTDFLNVLTPNDGLNVNKSGPKVAIVKQTHLIEQGGRLRGLTPLEWERAMGFPDDWTAGIPDAERYYALGDAFPPPMAEWLGKRLVQVSQTLPMLPEIVR